MTSSEIDGGVCAAEGFLAAGVAAGIKHSGGLDLALIVSEVEAACAGVFTTSTAAAAPVRVSKSRAGRGTARGVVANSGCANSVTGTRGLRDAEAMTEEAAGALGVSSEDMFVCSTGLIGTFLPMESVRQGIKEAASRLSPDDSEAMRAIMTTDTRPKRAAVELERGWRLGGIAKGAGMIAPKMAPSATMLAFLTTDAIADPSVLQSCLAEACDASFNRITVDGDTSTNDTVLAFANGRSGVSPSRRDLVAAFQSVCSSLAEAIVRDGEGATKFIRVLISGAAAEAEARLAARAVAESLLVKTAVFGGDANWGRVAAALGASGVEVDWEKIVISIGGVRLLDRGKVAPANVLSEARAAMRRYEVAIECKLGAGKGSAEMLTTDLSPEYVRLNAEYES